MAQTAVDVVVRVKDLAALDRLKKSLAGVDGATLKASQGINRFENSLKRLQGVLGGLAVGDQLRRAFGAAADFSATEQRLNNITKQYQQLAGIQELAAVSAQKFGVSTAQASADLADLGARLGSSGANLKDLNDIYEGFNTLLAVNAVNSQQAASAQLQLNQALGSGRLAGEEFNAINEATPQLLDKVAQVMGVARGELKKLASEGQITSKILIEALRLSAEEGGDALADFFETPAGQLKLFEKAIKDFQVTVGQQLLPLLTPLIEAATALLGLFSQLPGPVKATAVAVAALGAAFAILGGPITAVVAAIAGITLVIKKLADENEAFANALQSAWQGILAALDGVGAFFQAFFASITQQADAFIQYWQGIGTFLADTWNQGIANITEAFGRWQQYYNQVVQAIADAWNQLMQLIPNAFHQAVSALGGIFSPFVDFLNSAFGAISNAWNSLLESMGLNWGTLINEMIAAVLPLTRVFKAMGIDIGEAISGGVKAGFEAFNNFKPAAAPDLSLPGVSGLTTTPTPSGGGSGGGGKKGGGGKGAAERLLEEQQRQLKAAQDLLFASENQLKVLEGITEAEKLRSESAVKKLEIERQYAELLENSKSAEETLALQLAEKNELKANELELERSLQGLRDGALASIDEQIAHQQAIIAGKEEEYLLQKQINDLVASGGGTVSREEAAAKVTQLDGLKKQAEQTKELESQMSSLASGIAGEFTSAFKSIIDGSKSVNEAFADMLQGIADQFLNMAMKILQDALTQQLMGLFTGLMGGGAGGGAGGGFGVTPLTSGMKFFEGGGYTGDAPRSGGLDGKGGFLSVLHPQETVTDHYGDAAAAMAGASGAFAESSEAMQMATATRSANTAAAAEASAMQTAETYFASGKSTVSFDTYRVGEMDVVTREDAMKIGMQSAKQAEANVYKGLRNMPAVRGRSGVK